MRRPDWVITDDFDDVDLGTLKTGKEAEVRLVERTARDGERRHLLALKRYRPAPTRKGELEALGFTKASTFRNDIAYREARSIRGSRDRRAVAKMTTHGRAVVTRDWAAHEHEVLTSLWAAGAPVPYPIAHVAGHGIELEYLGDEDGAAPRLAQARLGAGELAEAWHQVLDALATITAAGWVHADLSAYNLLWWSGRVWVIDVPQAVDLVGSTQGFELLHRDVGNVCAWFAARGIRAASDPDAVFAGLL